MIFQVKSCRSSWLIVIFKKAGKLVLVIKPGMKMFTHRSGMTYT